MVRNQRSYNLRRLHNLCHRMVDSHNLLKFFSAEQNPGFSCSGFRLRFPFSLKMASSSSSLNPSERRGIPAASFVEDVQTYLSQSNLDVNSSLAFLQERLQQYKIVEMKLLAQQRDLQAKIPDIEKCLDIVGTLQAKKGAGEALVADFEVSEGIYSQAQIEDTDSVCLWLGANVMLSYSCEEAEALLTKNLENAKASLEVLVADLQFLRDQVTITQVTIARVYNWDVHQRRSRQPAKET